MVAGAADAKGAAPGNTDAASASALTAATRARRADSRRAGPDRSDHGAARRSRFFVVNGDPTTPPKRSESTL